MCCGIRLRSSQHQIIIYAYSFACFQLATKLSSIQFIKRQQRMSKRVKERKKCTNKIISDGIKSLVRCMSILRRKYRSLSLRSTTNKHKKMHGRNEK